MRNFDFPMIGWNLSYSILEPPATLEVDENTGDNGMDNKDKTENVVNVSEIIEKEDLTREEGLEGRDLFRCGNAGCEFRAENVADFRDHVAICDFTDLHLICYHCQKQSKHVATLVDHLKSHGKL